MRILYLQTSPVPPPLESSQDRFTLLSEYLEGEILQPIWTSDGVHVENVFGPGSWPRFSRGRFRYRWLLAWRWTGIQRFLQTLWFYLAEGLRAHREKPVDCVMTYSHMTTAMCGIILKLLTGASLVVEVVTSPDRIFVKNRPRPTLADKLRKLYSDFCLHLAVWSSDCVHLLYTGQLDAYPLLRNAKRAVFHEFVSLPAVAAAIQETQPYIVLVGAPWYLKGADLLVAAFRRLAADFPAYSLKIVGHFPDRAEIERCLEGTERIEVLKAVHHPEILKIIAASSILVLPSRCEGMGRVVLEAMAAGVPVVGSNVGGIPTLIRDGENGFLFPEDDVRALESRLRQLLSSRELRTRLGDRGRAMAMTEFSDAAYVGHFVKMIEIAVA